MCQMPDKEPSTQGVVVLAAVISMQSIPHALDFPDHKSMPYSLFNIEINLVGNCFPKLTKGTFTTLLTLIAWVSPCMRLSQYWDRVFIHVGLFS
jgi:hypothetical protein